MSTSSTSLTSGMLPLPSNASPDEMSAYANSVGIGIVLDMWRADLDEAQRAETEHKNGVDQIADAANIASGNPMLVMPQLIMQNSIPTTPTESASKAISGLAGATSDVPVKGSAAVSAFLMAHMLGENRSPAERDKGISMLTFIAATQPAEEDAQASAIAAITSGLEKLRSGQLEAASKFAGAWLESVQKHGEDLKELDKQQVIKAMNEYVRAAKDNPTLLDSTHLQTVIAVSVLALLTSAGPSPVSGGAESAISPVTISQGAMAQNPTMGQMDTMAAVAMIAALMAQVQQAQVVLLQIKEKPEIDSKKVAETFALENAKKILGFVADPSYTVFLRTLVESMAGKANLERNVALVKLNMLLNGLWLVSRAETGDVKFIEITMWVKQYLLGEKLPFAEGDIRYELLAKIKEHIGEFFKQFGKNAAASLEKGLMDIMRYMGDAEAHDELPDPKDAKKSYAGFLESAAPTSLI